METYFHGPITAICFLSDKFLCYAQGSHLVLLNISHQRIIDRRQVLPDGRRIFGVSNFVVRHNSERRVVLVFGERWVSVSYLTSLMLPELQQIALIRCSDWVFDVCFIENDDNSCFLVLCAQSHHACEVFSVNCTTQACQFTTRLQFPFEEITWSASIYVDKTTETITLASGCYSGNIKLFLFEKSLLEPLNDSKLYLSEETSKSLLLKGHRGPVFRIRWESTGNRLATTADDRCIRIWKKSTMEGVYFQQQVVLWDSTSRIWDLEFLPDDRIIAACEDGICRIWNISDEKCSIRLEDNYGMNVFCTSSWIDHRFSCFIATGAADSSCQIYRLEDILRRQTDRYSTVFELPCVEVTTNTSLKYNLWNKSQAGIKKGSSYSKESVKSIRWLSRESLMIYTDHNRIYHVGVWKQGQAWKQTWTLLHHVEDKILAPISMTFIKHGILIGTNCGQVLIFSLLDIKRHVEHRSKVDFVLRFKRNSFQATRKGAVMNIFSSFEENSNELLSQQEFSMREQIFIVTPDGCMFWYHLVWNVEEDVLEKVQLQYILKHPCKDGLFTAMCFHSKTSAVVCGDKKGKIFVFIPLQDIDSPVLMPIHSLQLHSDRIHCLSWIADNIFLSGSVDGMLFWNLFTNREDYQVQALCQRKCFYKVATVDKFLKDSTNRGLFLVGFHSKYLTIWDIIQEKEVISIDCGGWRRAHDVWLCSNEFMICFTRRGQLVLRYECFEDIHSIVKTPSNGFHGMRINHILMREWNGVLNLLSCGEDTMVRNSVFCTQTHEMCSLQILDCHISGVQCCAVDEEWLWTGSGKDQLIVWKKATVNSDIRYSQHIAQSTCHYYHKKDMYFGTLDKSQRMRFVNKVTSIATQRVTSLLVLPKHLLIRRNTLPCGILHSLIFVTRSDGSFALNSLLEEPKESNKWTIHSLYRFNVSQFSILCSDSLILPECLQTDWRKILIFACNTVGQLLIWQLGEMDLENPFQVVNEFSKNSIVISDLHQGAIHDLHVSLLENNDVLVVTGGEDQRMNSHLFHLDATSIEERPILVKLHSLVPNCGHSASVTAVWTDGKVIFSSGADHKLIIWEIKTSSDNGQSNIFLQPCKTVVSNVSDISCISVANDWLALAGSGVEFMKWK
ncbi:transducin family protein / WD-40 repeat family protein [Galdieria sulphuraria]|uniref:Transducin family protein / WD-40 repeat family protein n=1 Tax=Galdieria sulphuraria TaxID=130081 RepID=M2Y5W2_GALSU|nr:transducin family protein / WD-40 repeat family protein [Galdieria sulphuraria]EME31249.1 transducin family protein / WD-40 repeat family protein [Galdieria sulphuraria]|eukprot:XP_005707769.1 transducin family protein / WD-40 repeat family protein [Galdieria sulphuraria]